MIKQALLSFFGWGLYVLLVVLLGCLPALYMLGGIRNGNPEWHKWYPGWALWLVGKK